MAKILRHTAIEKNINIDNAGWVSIPELIIYINRSPRFHKITEDDIIDVVELGKLVKNRFSIKNEDGINYVRANQGHTIDGIDPGLVEITDPNELPVCIHGTYDTVIGEIEDKGLSRMSRNHIHMNTMIPTHGIIMSGMRPSCNRIVWINVQKAMELGIKFYRSINNVILSPGNEDGYIPPSCFEKITIR